MQLCLAWGRWPRRRTSPAAGTNTIFAQLELQLSLSVYHGRGVPQTPERAQRRVAAGPSAVRKDRVKGPNGARCTLGGTPGGLGGRRSVSWEGMG